MNQEQFNKSMQTTKNYVDSTIQDYTGGKKQVYLTQAEYDLLSDEEKNDSTKVYNITDAVEQEIPTKTSQLTNDSGFITEVPSEYVTETELNSKGYLTEHQDISGKANKSDIPTKTSQLENDSDYATNASVNTKLENVTVGTVISRLADMKWCVIGDSISDIGVGRTSKFYQEFIAERTGCTLVDWDGNGTGYTKAFNGQPPLIDRIDEIPEDSNVITIFLGTNDSVPIGTLGSSDTGTFYGAVEYCIKTIKEKYPLIPLGVMTPLPSKYKTNEAETKAIKEVCAKYYVPVLDLHSICNINLKSPFYVLNYMPDGLHPNDNLHRDISYRVQAWLENEVLVCKFTDNIIQRGLPLFPQSGLTYTAGSTLDLQVALSHIPNENQAVAMSCSTSDVTFNPSTLYFNKNKDVQNVTVTVPSSVSGDINIIGNSWGVTSSITIASATGGGETTVAVTGVSLNTTSHTMNVGDTITLTPTIQPTDATNKNVSWSSNNSNCSVSNGLVTANTAGDSIITVTTEDGNHTATCTITIQQTSSGDEGGGSEASAITIDDYIFKGDFADNSNTALLKDLSNYGNDVRLSRVTNWADGVMTIETPSGNAGITPATMKEAVNTDTVSIELCFKLNEGADTSATIVYLSNGKMAGALIDNGVNLGTVFRGIDTDGNELWIGRVIAKDLDIYNYNHIVYTATTAEINVYVNGVLNNTMDISDKTTLDHWLISSISAFSYLFTGDVKAFNIYKKELTAEQVASLYSNYAQ